MQFTPHTHCGLAYNAFKYFIGIIIMGNEFSDDYDHGSSKPQTRSAPHNNANTRNTRYPGYQGVAQHPQGAQGYGPNLSTAPSNVIYTQTNSNQPWIVIPGTAGGVTYLNTLTGQIYSTPHPQARNPSTPTSHPTQPNSHKIGPNDRAEKAANGEEPQHHHPTAAAAAPLSTAPPTQPRVVYVVRRPPSILDDMVDSFFAPVTPVTYVYNGVRPQQPIPNQASQTRDVHAPQVPPAANSRPAAAVGPVQTVVAVDAHPDPSPLPQPRPQLPHQQEYRQPPQPRAQSAKSASEPVLVASVQPSSSKHTVEIAAPPAKLPKGFQPHDDL
jgi:hypothetical protein